MNAKNDPIQAAEALVSATALTLKEAEIKFAAALDWLKVAIKAHAEAGITLAYVSIKQKGGVN